MNQLYIAKWPNGTITILSASNKKDLFFKLDSEGDPSCAEISRLNLGDGEIHITTQFTSKDNVPVLDEEGNPEINWHIGEFAENATARKVSFA